MLEKLKEEVYKANLSLVEHKLVILTWGNVSAVSDDGKYVVIKPSGADYAEMRPEHMVVTDLDGNVMEGSMRPSTNLATHLELYRGFPKIKSVVHTHSRYATAIAQAEHDLPCHGTTHADHFFGSVPCTRHLTSEEVNTDYELNTGRVIIETFNKRHIDYEAVPAVLVCKHGPFTWGSSIKKAVENAVVLEETACIALLARQFNYDITPAPQYLQDKHYYRKHGKNAYYGQR